MRTNKPGPKPRATMRPVQPRTPAKQAAFDALPPEVQALADDSPVTALETFKPDFSELIRTQSPADWKLPGEPVPLADMLAELHPAVSMHSETTALAFAWSIPGPDGYNLRIEVGDTADAEQARAVACASTIKVTTLLGLGERDLTTAEQNWIRTNPPQLVRDVADITIEHEQAIDENAALMARAEYVAGVAGYVASLPGAGSEDPIEAIQGYQAHVAADVQRELNTMRLELEGRARQMALHIAAVQESLRVAAVETGFGPPVVEVIEIPYPKFMVLVNDDEERREAAQWMPGIRTVSREFASPMTERERKVWQDTRKFFVEFRRSGARSQPEQAETDILLESMAGRLGV